jgi:hypothetical protein
MCSHRQPAERQPAGVRRHHQRRQPQEFYPQHWQRCQRSPKRLQQEMGPQALEVGFSTACQDTCNMNSAFGCRYSVSAQPVMLGAVKGFCSPRTFAWQLLRKAISFLYTSLLLDCAKCLSSSVDGVVSECTASSSATVALHSETMSTRGLGPTRTAVVRSSHF